MYLFNTIIERTIHVYPKYKIQMYIDIDLNSSSNEPSDFFKFSS